MQVSTKARADIELSVPGEGPDFERFFYAYNLDEDEVLAVLDELEIFQCTQCNWWLHPGEHALGHDCEGHDEMVCGDCCTTN